MLLDGVVGVHECLRYGLERVLFRFHKVSSSVNRVTDARALAVQPSSGCPSPAGRVASSPDQHRAGRGCNPPGSAPPRGYADTGSVVILSAQVGENLPCAQNLGSL